MGCNTFSIGQSVMVRPDIDGCGFDIPAVVVAVSPGRCDVRIGSGEVLNVGIGNLREAN